MIQSNVFFFNSLCHYSVLQSVFEYELCLIIPVSHICCTYVICGLNFPFINHNFVCVVHDR